MGPVLIVTDRDVVRLGLAEGVQRSLEAAGYHPDVFADVAGEPDLQVVDRAAAAVRTKPYRAVVGVGGGSAMDVAKLAAALATNPGSASDIIGFNRLAEPCLPMVLIPTTAGTGAEASRNAMVMAEGRKAFVGSPFLVPDAAILDPQLTVTLPASVTGATGLDALSHALECYLSTLANPFTSTASLMAMRLIARFLPTAYRQGGNLDARRAMLFAAYLGGLALNASAVLGHSMAYTVANRTHLPHGVTCAMALPYCVAYCLPGASQRIAAAAAEISHGQETQPEWLVRWLGGLNAELQIPASLMQVGIERRELQSMVDELLHHYPRPNNPVPLERGRLLVLYEYFHAGDLEGCLKAVAAG